MIKRLLYSDVDATTFTGGNYRSDFRLRMSLWNKVRPRIQVYSTTTRKDLFPQSLLAIPTDLNHFWDCKDVHCFVCGYIRKDHLWQSQNIYYANTQSEFFGDATIDEILSLSSLLTLQKTRFKNRTISSLFHGAISSEFAPRLICFLSHDTILQVMNYTPSSVLGSINALLGVS